MPKSNEKSTPEFLTLAVDPDQALWGVVAPQSSAQAWVSRSSTATGGEQLIVPGSFAQAEGPGTTADPGPRTANLAAGPGPSAALTSFTEDGQGKLSFGRARAETKAAGHLQELDLRLLSTHTPALGKRDSLRLAACWFGDQYQAAVCAERAKGHESDRDEVNVALTGERWPYVEDSRLSTTRDHAGIPIRFTLQAWLSDGPDDEHLHPWLIVGHRSGPTLTIELGDHTLRACMLECFRHDQQGAGVLAIITPR